MASPGSIGLGKIFGIPIELNWIFILMILFFWFFTSIGLVLVLLFVCVLIHELSHSVTARRNGVNVSKIILLPFGGASVIDTTKIDPKVEFNISISGPLMSLFLGGVFGVLAVIFPPGALEQLINELFLLNIFLGVLNVIPAFPMDGGRIFRSYMERKHNFFDATMITARVTRWIFVLGVLMAVGFLLAGTSFSLYYRLYVLLWTFIIIIFLYGGLRAEVESVVMGRETAGLKVGDTVSKHFLYIEPGAAIAELYDKVKSTGEHTIITKLGKDYGIVDLNKKAARAGTANSVAEISVPMATLDANMPVSDGLAKLTSTDIGIAAVKRRGKLIGILSYPQLQTFISLHMLKKGKGGKR